MGFDDGAFTREDREAILVGVLMEGARVEGVVSSFITVDGMDVTEKMADLIRGRFYPQIRAVFTSTKTFAGFNVLDLDLLHDLTGMPVISVYRWPPKIGEMLRLCGRFPDKEKRERAVLSGGEVHSMETRGKIYFQSVGMGPGEAARLIRAYSIHSALPEPIRLAHIIASGVSRGESKGRP